MGASARLNSDAPVAKVSWVKSTSLPRASVFVVDPHRMSILLPVNAVKRSVAVTGT